MTNSDKDYRYFHTANFYVASFLFTHGLELVNIDRGDPHRSLFVFRDTPLRENLINSYNFASPNDTSVLVDARTFAMAIKMLKDKLYQTSI